LKEAILHARDMPATEARKRMASMRRQVLTHDVVDWSQRFLDDLAAHAGGAGGPEHDAARPGDAASGADRG
ncbi:hypothetical protein K4G99_23340, partial [Mycobacterium tuberculosis]|nr:hypothetical protein [Mycobacterium tuberculosis]